MNVILPKGKYNSKILQVEPTIMWFTTAEIAVSIWTYRKIIVKPSFKSFGDNENSIRAKVLPTQTIEANTPTIVRFGCLVDLTDNFLIPPPQTQTIIRLECACCKKNAEIFKLKYKIPKYWSGPVDPNVPDFSILISSCWRLPGDYEAIPKNFPSSLYKIFNQYTLNSNLNIMLGDNVYLAEYFYNTESGLYERYKKLWDLPELKGSWSNIPWSAITDDHDLGLNNETYGGQGLYLCRSVFEKIWPNNSKNPISPLIWSMLRYDLCIIGLDDESFKTNFGNPDSTVLGNEQLAWLKQSLFSVKRLYGNPFILICVGLPFIPPNTGYFVSYPDQKKIEDMIVEFDLKNVFFLTGDTHLSDISVKQLTDQISIHELRNSPMSSEPRNPATRPNPYRIPGTLVDDYNFGKLFFSGQFGNRKLEYSNIIKDGTIPVKFSYKQII